LIDHPFEGAAVAKAVVADLCQRFISREE
jgi:hypothetical protein